jgi:hypothetical protein
VDHCSLQKGIPDSNFRRDALDLDGNGRLVLALDGENHGVAPAFLMDVPTERVTPEKLLGPLRTMARILPSILAPTAVSTSRPKALQRVFSRHQRLIESRAASATIGAPAADATAVCATNRDCGQCARTMEYDAARKRGEIAGHGDGQRPSLLKKKPLSGDAGLTRTEMDL